MAKLKLKKDPLSILKPKAVKTTKKEELNHIDFQDLYKDSIRSLVSAKTQEQRLESAKGFLYKCYDSLCLLMDRAQAEKIQGAGRILNQAVVDLDMSWQAFLCVYKEKAVEDNILPTSFWFRELIAQVAVDNPVSESVFGGLFRAYGFGSLESHIARLTLSPTMRIS